MTLQKVKLKNVHALVNEYKTNCIDKKLYFTVYSIQICFMIA